MRDFTFSMIAFITPNQEGRKAASPNRRRSENSTAQNERRKSAPLQGGGGWGTASVQRGGDRKYLSSPLRRRVTGSNLTFEKKREREREVVRVFN